MAAAPTSDDFSRRSGHTNIAPCVCAFERERGFFVRFDSFFLSIEVARFLFFIFSWTFSLFFGRFGLKTLNPFTLFLSLSSSLSSSSLSSSWGVRVGTSGGGFGFEGKTPPPPPPL